MEQLTLNSKELMTMLNICRKSVDNFEKKGLLPQSFKLGNSKLWWKEEVIQKINTSRTKEVAA